MDAVVDLAKISLPALLVLYVAYLLIRSFLAKEIELKNWKSAARRHRNCLPLRLRHERMCLFLEERISPQNMLVRLNVGLIPSKEFHQMLLE